MRLSNLDSLVRKVSYLDTLPLIKSKGLTLSQKKQVLILCTGNSCRSIMAEAMINAQLKDYIQAQSSGVTASGQVNPDAKALLVSKGEWKDEYHSKVIQSVINTHFDLVVTVCDNAKETCPIFTYAKKNIHLGFDDPSGKAINEYEITYNLIQKKLLPILKKELSL